MLVDKKLMEIYEVLLEHFGHRGWWPGDSRFEIVIGAILTQAVSWKNVEKTILALKAADLFTEEKILAVSPETLADTIRPALYHRQKARKLQVAMDYIRSRYDCNYDLMFSEPLPELRNALLSLWGIGAETADSILLYAGNYQVFVVDSYTRRIFYRLGMVDENISYKQMQGFMVNHVTVDTAVYNEYHALLVALGANYCKKTRPDCLHCPLDQFCNKLKIMQENYRGE